MAALTEYQQEANEVVDELIGLAQQNRWAIDKRGVNAKYAWVALIRDHGEKLQAFYAVDDSTTNDKFIYGSTVVPQEYLRIIVEADFVDDVRRKLVELGFTWPKQEGKAKPAPETAMPPTNAAHSAAHPPVVPPTVDEAESAAHERALNAAHSKGTVPPTTEAKCRPSSGDPKAKVEADSAAYEADNELPGMWESADFLGGPEDTVPPTYTPGDPPGVYTASKEMTEEMAEGIAIGYEAQAHIKAAGQPAGQLDTVEAVRAQFATKRNWSDVASSMSDAELIKAVTGSTIRWRNRLSGAMDSALVTTVKEAGKYQTKITPTNFDAEAAGEDLRVLHFLEKGAGFRSVAVSQIKAID